MIETAIASFVFKLVSALVAVLLARMALMFFDAHLSRTSFQEWINNATDQARATYYGLRFLAVCIAVGLVLG